MDREYENAKNAASKLAEMPAAQSQTGAMMGGVGRQSTKAMLLEKAEAMRREAHQLEALAYAIEHIRGEGEQMLHRLLSAHIYR